MDCRLVLLGALLKRQSLAQMAAQCVWVVVVVCHVSLFDSAAALHLATVPHLTTSPIKTCDMSTVGVLSGVIPDDKAQKSVHKKVLSFLSKKATIFIPLH